MGCLHEELSQREAIHVPQDSVAAQMHQLLNIIEILKYLKLRKFSYLAIKSENRAGIKTVKIYLIIIGVCATSKHNPKLPAYTGRTINR